MDWKTYEKAIRQHLADLYPGASIRPNVKLPGRYSEAMRQIDVLIEDEVAGFPTRIVVDGKHFDRRVDVTNVDCFIGLLEDVDATHGLLVTPHGYSRAALRRAYNHPKRVLLDVLDLSDLQLFQGLVGIPYSGNKAMWVTAPFGWIVDSTRNEGFIATLYQRGRTLEEARQAHEWMYVNHWHKDAEASTMAEVVDMQTRRMEATYELLDTCAGPGPTREDGSATTVRVATYNNSPFKEITGYVDFEGFVAFFVLFTIPELESVNTRKLMHVLKYSRQCELRFDNHRVIEALEKSTECVDDPVERAHAYTQIGIWYAEMNDRENAVHYYRWSFRTSPTVYRNFQPLLVAELTEDRQEAAAECAKALFRLAPDNPRAMKDILEAYGDEKYREELRDLVGELKVEHEDAAEAQVNIGFHYGMRLVDAESFESALRELRSARRTAEAISDEHPALPGIDEMLNGIQEELGG
ncbi:MAG: restriction endonuclease [Acidobacteria bacterium]|nr:restriction endonuclease [Acidobacteriota bacterium]